MSTSLTITKNTPPTHTFRDGRIEEATWKNPTWAVEFAGRQFASIEKFTYDFPTAGIEYRLTYTGQEDTGSKALYGVNKFETLAEVRACLADSILEFLGVSL